MRPPRTFYVSLKVGSREFIGEGMSRQMARHNAAKKALEILRNLQVPDGGEITPVPVSLGGSETPSSGENVGMDLVDIIMLCLKFMWRFFQNES